MGENEPHPMGVFSKPNLHLWG